MNKLQSLYTKNYLNNYGFYSNTQDAFDNNYSKELDFQKFIEGLADDYLYNYYTNQERIDRYFGANNYLYCTMNSSMTIGSIYYKESRVRLSHNYYATYEIFNRIKTKLANKDLKQNFMQKYLLAPININVSAKDRENLIKVFYANLILAKKYIFRTYQENSNRAYAIELMQKAFKLNLNKAQYEICLNIILSLIAFSSCFFGGIYEKCMYKHESILGDEGFIYTMIYSHNSRGRPIRLIFDNTKLLNLVKDLILDIDCCRTPKELHNLSYNKEDAALQEFNQLANAFSDSIIPDFIKNNELYANESFDLDKCIAMLEKLC